MPALKVREFHGVQKIASEAIEKNELEQALRAAQYAYDAQLFDLHSEFRHREAKLRDDYLAKLAEITAE